MPEKVLVVDDEPSVVQLCLRVLVQRGYDATGLSSGREAIALLESRPVDLLVVDIKMPDVDGLAVLHRARELYPDLAAVIITGFGTLSSAVEALHAGAHRFVLKPFGVDDLARAVQETLEQWRRDQERRRLRVQLPILEIAQALLVEGDIALLTQQLLGATLRELAAEQAALLVFDPETDELRIAGTAGPLAGAVGVRIPADSAFLEHLRQGSAPIVAEPQQWLQQFLPAALDANIVTVACVPLRTVKRFVGALCLGRTEGTAPFTPSELGLLTIIGGQIATVLENAHLYTVVARGKREWEETFDAITDGISIHSADFRLTRANVALAKWLGKAPRDLIGQHCYELIHHATAPPADCPALDSSVTGKPKSMEMELPQLGGVFLCTVYPRFDGTGRFQGVVHILRDITEHKQAQARAAEVEVLREMDRLRSELTANVSHELRTPLGLIKVMSTTLLRQDFGLDEATRREFLGNIADEAGRLERIVDNLLDLSRQEGGQLRLERCDTDLGHLLQETAAEMTLQAPRHRLACEVPAEALRANVDPERIGQVLRNLVGNAIKYSPAGGTITVRGQQLAGDVLIQVADEGIGIPPQDRERVFERFYRVPNEVTMRERGAGLGLSVCKGIVEAHGGRIWVESTPGQGSTFSLTLPAMR